MNDRIYIDNFKEATTIKDEITIKHEFIPSNDDIAASVNHGLSIIDELRTLVLKDANELYIRELMNRIDRCTRFIEDSSLYDFDKKTAIAILHNDKHALKAIYEAKLRARSIFDMHENFDGQEVLEEILGVGKNENI